MNHIFIYGPPGSGKTTVGINLAQRLELSFIDLDHAIEMNSGMTIPFIMEQQGESAFREMESAALRTVIDIKESVIALGGGSLLRDENRALAEKHGKIILLYAEIETLLGRLESDVNQRPLLIGDMQENLSRLLSRREAHYRSFPLSIQVDNKSISQITLEAQTALGRYRLSGMGHYDVVVQNNLIEQAGDLLLKHGLKNPIIVTDENVKKLHAEKVVASLRGSGFRPKVITIPAGEAYKTLDTINSLWHGFVENGLDRKSTVIALGGGVIGDMAGFTASSYMRGVGWVALPTTLLSMVDASIGGKTGFDLPEGKNLIGSFYPPRLVLADPRVLKTLPEEELISGLAEVVKAGVISNPELFQMCSRGFKHVIENLEEIVKQAVAVKIQIIEEDPFESGIRATLNLGHTVGHAVEKASGYRIRHGEAVAIGMVAEAKLAERLKVAGKGLSDTIAGTLRGLNLPIDIPGDLPRDEIIRAMSLDKKKANGIVRFALPVEIGRVELVDVENLGKVLEENEDTGLAWSELEPAGYP
jgi:shikimate kinase/3-dehydroquinate synthase